MESSYKRQDDLHYDNTTKQKRSYYWDTAIGLNKVDGLTPSDYLQELKQESIEGRKTYDEVERELGNYYGKQVLTPAALDTRECDIVSTRIARILESRDFVFSPITFKFREEYT